MLTMGSTYTENDVPAMNVIFSMAYDALVALLVVNEEIHIAKDNDSRVTWSWGS